MSIIKRGNEFCVIAGPKDRNFGCFPTRAQAESRLRQIERFSDDEKRRTDQKPKRPTLETLTNQGNEA